MGVRVIDLRISRYVRAGQQESRFEYWCGHTFLSVPLDLVLSDIELFVKKNPTELVFLQVRPDYSPINVDYTLFSLFGWTNSRVLKCSDLFHLVEYIRNKIGTYLTQEFIGG